MAQVYENVGHIALLLLLLVGSAFFSGSETAFFNLSRRQINLLKKSRHKFQNLVAALLKQPKQLLSCLLFGNMIVNVLFFALASVLTVRLEQQVGPAAAAFAAFFAFCLLVLLGEILPKSLAYTASRPLSVAAALPVLLCLRLFKPLVFVFRTLVVEPALRLLLGPAQPAKPITTGEFKALMEHVRKRGLITTDESRLFAEVIELGFLKVRDCLRPRVDMIACAVEDSSQKARDIMLKNKLTKLPVYAGPIDNIIGLVHFRQLLLDPEATLDTLIRKVDFVPEQKTVESLLEFFRKTGTDTAVVVDEYGGIAGSVCLEDVAEELLGPIEFARGTAPIEQIGPFEYRLAGNLAIHDWAGAFGIEPAQTRLATIGGLVTAALGKIPKAGDVAYLKNLKFTVESVKKHRIETLILFLQPPPTDAK